MYKSGKSFVTAAIATVALTAGMMVSVNASASDTTADTDAANSTATQTVSDSNNSSASSEASSSASSDQTPASDSQGTKDQGQDQTGKDDQQATPKTVTIIEQITNVGATENGSDASLPEGVKQTEQQSVTFTLNQDGKWDKTEIPAYQITPVNSYYTKVNGKWATAIPAVEIFDPTKVTSPITVTVQYIKSTKVIKPTDEKDKDQSDLFGTVTDTINYTAPAGVELPDGTKNPDSVEVKVSRDKTVDVKDNSVTYGNWTGEAEKDYQIPQIAGYTSYVNGKKATVIKAEDFKVDSDSKDVPKGETFNITYQVSEDYNKDVDQSIEGNWGYLETLDFENNSVHVKGWNATNASREGQYHYIIIMNQTNNKELGRVAIDLADSNVARTDIPSIHNVWNAARSGFDVTIKLNLNNLNVGDKIIVLSRWTSDKDGNTGTTTADLWFNGTDKNANERTYTVSEGQNLANLDKFEMNGNNGIAVSGWNATNESLDYKYHWLILFDATTHKEISRQLMKDGDEGVSRPDVAKAYPTTFNADKSGFSTYFSLKNGVNLYNSIQLISRYTNDVNGNGPSYDYWFPGKQFMDPYAPSAASLDDVSYTKNGLHVYGWFATGNMKVAQNLFLILWDNTASTQASSKLVQTVPRADVATVYPIVAQAAGTNNVGFDTYFTGISLVPGHNYTIVARYSTSFEGNGGKGAYTDCWYTNKKYTFNLNNTNAGYFDSYTINDGKLTVSGWHATDMSAIENNHWLILLDSTDGNKEVQRIQITNVARPDVAAAYSNMMTAGNSGFSGQFDLSKLQAGHTYTLVSRYAVDANNAAQYTDYWFTNAFTLNKQAYNIDSFTQNEDGSFHVSGWMASDYSLSQPNAYLFLINDQGQELSRQKVKLTSRPDVAKVYPSIYNSDVSGFDTDLKLNDSSTIDKDTNENVHFVLRFTNGEDGNPTSTDKAADQISKSYAIKDGKLEG